MIRNTILFTLGILAVATSLSAQVPLLTWKDRVTKAPVKLQDFAGEIVVLDYFAYWCVPCGPASKQIEEEIAKHYGDPATQEGVPVRVLGINIEHSRQDLTEKFIARAGIGRVLDDAKGASMEYLGVRALPFIVVLDGRAATAESGPTGWSIAYQHNGLESIEKLRAVIDELRSGKTKVKR